MKKCVWIWFANQTVRRSAAIDELRLRMDCVGNGTLCPISIDEMVRRRLTARQSHSVPIVINFAIAGFFVANHQIIPQESRMCGWAVPIWKTQSG